MMYVIAYDIATNERRTRVLNALRNSGIPVQRSVAECELTPAQMVILREALVKLIKPTVDQVRIYTLCQTCYFRSEVLGPDPIPLAGPLSIQKRKRRP